MREYLSLPPEIVPATLKKQVRASAEMRGDDSRRDREGGRREGGGRGFGGGRDGGYRGGEGKSGAPGEYNPEFRGGGGFGRGSGVPR